MYRITKRKLVDNAWVYEEVEISDLSEIRSIAFTNLAPGQCQSCDLRNGGPQHFGSPICRSGSLAAGGNRSHCSCDACY